MFDLFVLNYCTDTAVQNGRICSDPQHMGFLCSEFFSMCVSACLNLKVYLKLTYSVIIKKKYLHWEIFPLTMTDLEATAVRVMTHLFNLSSLQSHGGCQYVSTSNSDQTQGINTHLYQWAVHYCTQIGSIHSHASRGQIQINEQRFNIT